MKLTSVFTSILSLTAGIAGNPLSNRDSSVGNLNNVTVTHFPAWLNPVEYTEDYTRDLSHLFINNNIKERDTVSDSLQREKRNAVFDLEDIRQRQKA